MSIDQKELKSILGSEIVGDVSPITKTGFLATDKRTIDECLIVNGVVNIPAHFNIQEELEKDRQKWLTKFKIELDRLYGFVLRSGAVKPEIMAEILEMYPENVLDSVKKFAESKGLIEIY